MRAHRSLALLAPVLLAGFATAAPQLVDDQKISSTEGGFAGPLNDGDWFGFSLASLGDLDGDTVTDLAVGARYADDGGMDRGAVWVLFLNPDKTVKASTSISAMSGGLVGPLLDGDEFGSSLTNLGDLDGDGVTDLVVGAPRDDDGSYNAGAVWILFMNADGTVKGEQKISALQGGFTGPLAAGDNFGTSVATFMDYDSDGNADLLVGAQGDDEGGANSGAVWLLLLQNDGTVTDHHKLAAQHFGAAAGDNLGYSLAHLGQLDGLVADDFAVGARFADAGGVDRGEVWIAQVHATDPTLSTFVVVNDVTCPLLDLNDGDRFGSSITALGPPQGFLDQHLAIGATGDDDGGPNRGVTYIVGLEGAGLVAGVGRISATDGGLSDPLDDRDIFGTSLALLEPVGAGMCATFAVGSALDDDGGADRGAARILDVCLDGPTATFRNDSGGQNATGYIANAPILDGTWSCTVDTSIGSNTAALVAGYASPLEFPTRWGVLLVNLADPQSEILGPLVGVGAPSVVLTLDLTNDLGACGAFLATQAITFGSQIVMHNAYDLVVGFEQ